MYQRLSAVVMSGLLLMGSAAAGEGAQRKLEGSITSVEKSANAIIVKTGAPPRRLKFFLARDGHVTSGGRPVGIRELKRGERVEVSYTEANAYRWAHAIAVVGGGSEASVAGD